MTLRKLVLSRRLWPLNLAQACGAVNDNLVKNALLVLALFRLHAGSTGLSALAGALFIAPFMMLSATAGVLADRYPKPRLIRIYKVTELLLMVTAAIGFAAQNISVLLLVLVGLGVQAALFGPAKYGVLPESLADAELLGGNAIVEATTFLSIVVGTVAGGGLMLLDDGPALVALLGCVLALLGLFAAFRMMPLPAASPALRLRANIFAEALAVLSAARRIRPVWLSLLGISWFWTMGATLLTELPILTRDTIGASASVLTLLLAVFAVGVGIGAVGCTHLLHNRPSARIAPFAALGISLFCWDFAHAAMAAKGLMSAAQVASDPAGWRLLVDMLLLAACGGTFSVPLYAIIQRASPVAARSRMVAANNVMNALFMIIGAVCAAGLAALGLPAPGVLMVAAGANGVAAALLFLTRIDPTPLGSPA